MSTEEIYMPSDDTEETLVDDDKRITVSITEKQLLYIQQCVRVAHAISDFVMRTETNTLRDSVEKDFL